MPRIIQSKVTRIQIVSVEVTWSDEEIPAPSGGLLDLTARDAPEVPRLPPGARKSRKKNTRPLKPPAEEADG